jgi:hypothetical protein
MLGTFLGSSCEVIQVGEDDIGQIMKDVCHILLESCTDILQAKRHDTICKITPRGSECGFILIVWVDLNLIIARESVHKGESFMADAVVDNLINERHWKVVFGTCVIEITKVCENVDSALFFVNGYRVGNP